VPKFAEEDTSSSDGEWSENRKSKRSRGEVSYVCVFSLGRRINMVDL
jgi:hypothetical protein